MMQQQQQLAPHSSTAGGKPCLISRPTPVTHCPLPYPPPPLPSHPPHPCPPRLLQTLAYLLPAMSLAFQRAEQAYKSSPGSPVGVQVSTWFSVHVAFRVAFKEYSYETCDIHT
jgi:hypothetical protein